ncbi:MAG: hypothetical protein JHD16_01320 [Solirubrobacteraceae bacterium]|nr:hypothetical protein [Solirubrobacteraceae bacterium]
MTRVLASDLDRTLVHSSARMAPDEVDSPVIEIYKGRGITVTRQATLDALAALHETGGFIPVTTRSKEQVARIEPIWAMAQTGWLVCTNGATILRHGKVDAAWEAQIDQLCADSAPLAQAHAAFTAEFGTPETVDWMPLLRDCDGVFLYCTLKLDLSPRDLESRANQLFAPLGWRAILHGRKLYALPNGVCKGRAAQYLRERLEIDELMAAGDSELDVELLLAAEHRWCPIDAELVEHGAVPPRTRLTQLGHVGAGEEIALDALRWARETVAAG